MVLWERSADDQLIEVLHEVFDSHTKDAVVLVPLVCVATRLKHFGIFIVGACLNNDVLRVELDLDIVGPEVFIEIAAFAFPLERFAPRILDSYQIDLLRLLAGLLLKDSTCVQNCVHVRRLEAE